MAAHDATYRLGDLRAELGALDAKIAADVKKRRKLAAAVVALEALEGPTKKSTPKPVEPAPPFGPSLKTPALPMQIVEAASLVLREAGKPLNATVILEQIDARKLVGRPVLRTSLVAAMDRKYHDGEMFDKPQPGTYSLLSSNGAK